MNGSTKILTVSYGTFSCTLEGFDDPLGSMREIAEYFRDLAADDRYFGAEPPTPDVEMLQKIAEKEVQRRVEARVSDTGVALVALDSSVASRAEKPAAAPVPADDDDTKGPLTFDDDFLMSDEPEDVLAVDPDARPETEGPAESVAEKLRRIRAVVSKSIETEESQSARPEQHGQASADPKRDRALTETIQQITADLSDDEDAPQRPPEVEEVVESDTVRADAVAPEPKAAMDEVSEPVEEPPSSEADEAELEQNGYWPNVETREEPQPKAVSPDVETREEPATTSGDGWDFDTTSVEDEDEPEEDVLSDDIVKRTVSDVLGKVSDRAAADTADAVPKPERVTTRTLTPEPEADVGRLLDETDTKLNEDETVRRRRVISQMRAAVAATKADRLVSRQVSREVEEEAEKDPYREDLTEAVQDTPKPEPSRKHSAPPLMLVSSQRIDTKPLSETEEPQIEADEAPARPETPEGFAEFAESMGAKDLHELLEAAAAYTVFAEGQSSFTRPEIMKRVARVDPTIRLSREESLRSFGQLLRQGKFKKLERGQFTIGEDTKFNPEQRFVGQ